MRSCFLVMLCGIFSGCAKHVTVKPEPPAFNHPTWVAQIQEASRECPKNQCEEYLVVVWTGGTYAEAKEEICTKSHFCIGPEPAGQVFVVQRWRK